MRDNKGRFIKSHAHHYLFESPNGTHSTGVCVHCGETQTIPNSLPPVSPRGMMKRLMGLARMNDPGEKETPHGE